MAKELNVENFYTVYYWMSTDLKLSGVEKDLYALIYGYYRNGNKCYYSYSQLSQITGTYKNKVIRSLEKLEAGGFIEIQKKENGKNVYRILEGKLEEINLRNEDKAKELTDADRVF